jgi:alpha-N-arabinofuranosidase
LDEVYNLEDALVCAQYLNAFIRRADVVKVACLAQIVNVISAVVTSPTGLLKQSIYWPSALYAANAKGASLTPVVDAPRYSASGREDVPYVDVSASYDQESGDLSVFLVNRSVDEPVRVTIEIDDRDVIRSGSAQVLTGENPKAANTWEHPDAVSPAKGTSQVTGRSLVVEVPRLGMAVVAGAGTRARK